MRGGIALAPKEISRNSTHLSARDDHMEKARSPSERVRRFGGTGVLDLAPSRSACRPPSRWGADVIKVEAPETMQTIGSSAISPIAIAASFWFYNLNKRSLTLDLTNPRGAELLRELAKSADIVIESFAPGHMAAMGLGWDELRKLNPALILLSVASFGQSGPFRDFEADDTVLTALAGMLYVNGFPGRAPVRPLGLQAYHSASYFGAIAVMCALFGRDKSGEGSWIDLSMQEATAASVEHVASSYFENGIAEPRRGTLHWSRFFRVGKCRDGYIMHCTLGDWTSLIEWVKSDGKEGDLDAPEYDGVMHRYLMAASIRRAG